MMEDNPEQYYLAQCLKKIEILLKRGSSDQWTGYDFEQLSLEIQLSTGILLSVTTLKRIWGKLKYDSLPAITTLNTLAKFAGSIDWNAFKQQSDQHSSSKVESLSDKVHRKSYGYSYGIVASVMLVIIGSALFFYSKSNTNLRHKKNYIFSSNKILHSGLPNSVIFNYSVPPSETDSIFIAQSWDTSRKAPVSIKSKVFSSIYYEPGHYTAKLIVGDSVVKEHELLITSAGWLAMVPNTGESPIYFQQKDIKNGEEISVDEQLITKYNLPMLPTPPIIHFYNVQDFGGITIDNFSFETSIKGSPAKGDASCQRAEISIMGKDDVMSIPLCAKGCVGNISLYAWGQDISSKTADLSAFGCMRNEWTDLRITATNGMTEIFINNEIAYAIKSSNRSVPIIGVRYTFQGSGAIRNTRLTSTNSNMPLM